MIADVKNHKCKNFRGISQLQYIGVLETKLDLNLLKSERQPKLMTIYSKLLVLTEQTDYDISQLYRACFIRLNHKNNGNE